MQSRGHCASSRRNGQAPARPHSAQQRALKVLRRHILGLLPAVIAVPAKADEGIVTLISKTENLSGYQAQVLEYNLRIQRQNNAPSGFPSFIRDKFDIAVIAEGYQVSSEGASLALFLCVQLNRTMCSGCCISVRMVHKDCPKT